MFEPMDKLILGFITGLAFGFLLQKGRVAKYQVILGQLLLKDWTVVKVMATAIVVGAAGVYALLAMRMTTLDVWPFQVGGVLVGALLFGIGLAVFGYCPGTSIAGSGEGSRDAMVGVAGMLAGAWVFVAAYPRLEPLINAFGNKGKLTLPQVLGVSPWVVIALLAAVVALALWLIEHFQGRGTPGQSPERKHSEQHGGRVLGSPGMG